MAGSAVPSILLRLNQAAEAYNAACRDLASMPDWPAAASDSFLAGSSLPTEICRASDPLQGSLARAMMESLIRAPVSVRTYTERDAGGQSRLFVMLLIGGREALSVPENVPAADLVARPLTGLLDAASYFRDIDTERVRHAVTTGWTDACADPEILRLSQRLERFFQTAHRFFAYRVVTVEVSIAPAQTRAERLHPVMMAP